METSSRGELPTSELPECRIYVLLFSARFSHSINLRAGSFLSTSVSHPPLPEDTTFFKSSQRCQGRNRQSLVSNEAKTASAGRFLNFVDLPTCGQRMMHLNRVPLSSFFRCLFCLLPVLLCCFQLSVCFVLLSSDNTITRTHTHTNSQIVVRNSQIVVRNSQIVVTPV